MSDRADSFEGLADYAALDFVNMVDERLSFADREPGHV